MSRLEGFCRGEIYTDFYTEEGGAKEIISKKKKKKCYFGLRPLLLVVEGKGKSKHFTKQIASFSSVRMNASLVLARNSQLLVKITFLGKVETAGRLTIKPRLGIMALVQVMPSGVSNFSLTILPYFLVLVKSFI